AFSVCYLSRHWILPGSMPTRSPDSRGATLLSGIGAPICRSLPFLPQLRISPCLPGTFAWLQRYGDAMFLADPVDGRWRYVDGPGDVGADHTQGSELAYCWRQGVPCGLALR